MSNDDTATVCANPNCRKPLSKSQKQNGQVQHQPSVIPHRPTVLEPGSTENKESEQQNQGVAQQSNHRPTVYGMVENSKQHQQNQDVTFNTPEPKPQTKKVQGTVNFYDNPMGMFQTEFTLTPLKRNNEKHEFSPLNFEGDEVELNRQNLEQNNMSITSQTQAVITCEDGKFFIVDKSEYKTTFVQAKDKIEIKDGDIVLMGNRMFEFHNN
jgi:hypothetical protein